MEQLQHYESPSPSPEKDFSLWGRISRKADTLIPPVIKKRYENRIREILADPQFIKENELRWKNATRSGIVQSSPEKQEEAWATSLKKMIIEKLGN